MIYGNGDFARLVTYFLSDIYNIVAYCVGEEFLSVSRANKIFKKPLIDYKIAKNNFLSKDYKMFIAIGYTGMNQIRQKIFNQVKDDGYNLISYIHPSAVIARDTDISTQRKSVYKSLTNIETSIKSNKINMNNAFLRIAHEKDCHFSI